MSNPWPKVINIAPPGHKPNAVALVRQAHDLKGFEQVPPVRRIYQMRVINISSGSTRTL
jgi:hypothetical protein